MGGDILQKGTLFRLIINLTRPLLQEGVSLRQQRVCPSITTRLQPLITSQIDPKRLFQTIALGLRKKNPKLIQISAKQQRHGRLIHELC